MTALADLMSMDPLHLTDTDLDQIISELRAQRHLFVTTNDKKIGTPSSRQSKKQKLEQATSLNDLLGDL